MRKMRYASQTKVTSVVMAVLMTLFFMLSLAPASLADPPHPDPDCPPGTTSVKLDGCDSLGWTLDTWHAIDDGTSGIEVKFTAGSVNSYMEFDWRTVKDEVYVKQVYIKAGNELPASNTFTYEPPAQHDEGLAPDSHAISHITFCYLIIEKPECPEIDFEVTKTVDRSRVPVGDTVYFEVYLKNTGDTVIDKVYVEDPMLQLSETVYDLAVGEGVYFSYPDYDMDFEMEGATCVTNVVYATYGYVYGDPVPRPFGGGGDCPPVGPITRWATREVCAYDTPPCPVVDFEVTKTVDRSRVPVGDTVYFEVYLKNTGDTVIDKVYVEDPMLQLSETVYDLAVGEGVYFSYPDYDMDFEMEGATCVTNVVYATYGYVYGDPVPKPFGGGGDCPPVGPITRWATREVCAYECPEIDFEIRKTVDDGNVLVGDTVYFEIRLENTGETLIDEVYVEDEMFEWGRYIYDLDVGDVVYFRDHSAAPPAIGEVVYYHDLDYTFTDDICVTNVVYATYGEPQLIDPPLLIRGDCPPIGMVTRWDTAQSCARDPIQKEPDIDIEKLVNGQESVTIRRGQEVTYSITVTNTGDYDLPCVKVVDETLGWDYSFTEDLDVGDSVTFYIYDNPTSNVTNTAYARDCEFRVYDEDDARVSIRKPPSNKEYEVEIEKLVDGKKVVTVDEGTEVTYTITVTNTGDYDLFDLVVEDDELDLYFEIDELEEGEEWSTEFDYTPEETLINTASVTDDDRDLYDEDDAKVNVREEEEFEEVPEPFEPAALPYTGASGNMAGGIGVLMLAAAATIKRKF